MLGMRMQQNQAIMDVMKELLKAHQSDISDLRKTQLTGYNRLIEQAANAQAMGNMKLYKSLKGEADEYLSRDFSNFGMAAQLLNGGTGGMKDHVLGPEENKGWSIFDMFSGGRGRRSAPADQAGQMLSPTPPQTQAPEMAYTGMSYNPTQIIQPPQRTQAPARPAPKVQMAPQTAPQAQGLDQFGHTMGEVQVATRGQYKGRSFKYIGNDQWQPI
jgi:hypothetical protein